MCLLLFIDSRRTQGAADKPLIDYQWRRSLPRCGLGREGAGKGRAGSRAAFGAEPARRLLPLNHWCPRSARARVAYSCIACDDRFKAPTASRHELQTCTRARTCGVSV